MGAVVIPVVSLFIAYLIFPPPPRSPPPSIQSLSLSTIFSTFVEFFVDLSSVVALFFVFAFISFILDLDFLFWLRDRALVQAFLRGLRTLGNLGRGLFVGARSEPTSDGREAREEDTDTEKTNSI